MGRLREKYGWKRDIVPATCLHEAEERRLKWFCNVERMGFERQARRMMNAKIEGTRPVSTPRTGWKDVIRKDLESSCLNVEQVAFETWNGNYPCWPQVTTTPREVKSSKKNWKKVLRFPLFPCFIHMFFKTFANLKFILLNDDENSSWFATYQLPNQFNKMYQLFSFRNEFKEF